MSDNARPMVRHGLFLLFMLVLALPARAHTVPSITLEAIFSADRRFEMRVNIDPRLVISDKPTTLPPIEAAWYREQTPEQLQATFTKALEYLKKSVTLRFGGTPLPWPEAHFQPMDGANNTPLTNDTKEVHLLATVFGKAPEGDFQVALSNEANTSLILLNSFDGKVERRPQVMFAGETTRPFALPTTGTLLSAPEAPTQKPMGPPTVVAKDRSWWAWILMAATGLWLIRRMLRNFASA